MTSPLWISSMDRNILQSTSAGWCRGRYSSCPSKTSFPLERSAEIRIFAKVFEERACAEGMFAECLLCGDAENPLHAGIPHREEAIAVKRQIPSTLLLMSLSSS